MLPVPETASKNALPIPWKMVPLHITRIEGTTRCANSTSSVKIEAICTGKIDVTATIGIVHSRQFFKIFLMVGNTISERPSPMILLTKVLVVVEKAKQGMMRIR